MKESQYADRMKLRVPVWHKDRSDQTIFTVPKVKHTVIKGKNRVKAFS